MTAAAPITHDDDSGTTLRQYVADEVRAWLGRRRISGAQLAREMGKSQTFVARRLDGRQAFDVDDLELVARVLRISVSDLMPRPNPQYPGHELQLVVNEAQVSEPSESPAPNLVAVNGMCDQSKVGVTHRVSPSRTSHLPLIA